MATNLPIPNSKMRALFLQQQGITTPARGKFDKEQLLGLIHQLAYVQVDSVNVVERAHHLILFARNPGYRREMLRELLERDRQLFEHWTHDASILPVSYFRHWKHRFEAARRRLDQPGWRKRLGPRPERVLNAVRSRIRSQGPLRVRDFESPGGIERGSWWDWTHEKTALEFLWRFGELGISRRDGFQKVYAQMQEVVPARERARRVDRKASVDWKCREALRRLGVATAAEIANFWSSFPTTTVRAWVDAERSAGRLIDVVVETADGSPARPRVGSSDLLMRLGEARPPPRSMRLLSPFDPVIRDRGRTGWLFGFDYRIEVFVPAVKRTYGYYVLPILEGERFTGRIDLKAHRQEGFLEVKGLWWEPNVRVTPRRRGALQRCLARLAKFVGVGEVRGLTNASTRSRS